MNNIFSSGTNGVAAKLNCYEYSVQYVLFSFEQRFFLAYL